MIDWQAVRDAYVDRFGPFEESDPIKDDGDPSTGDSDDFDLADLASLRAAERPARFFALTHGEPEVPASPVTYATFGAVHGGPGFEIFLTAATPYLGFEQAVRDLAPMLPRDLKPLDVVRCPVRFTLFDFLLVAPLEDGTFVLGEEGGSLRHAFRLVPITPAERALAARAPDRLLALLRAAGALVADPLRACVVEPDRDGGRRANAAALLADTRRKAAQFTERYQRLVALGAPDVIVDNERRFVQRTEARLAFLEARALELVDDPDLLAPEAIGTRLSALLREVMRASVLPYAGLVPPRVAGVFRAFMVLIMNEHPLVHPVFYEAGMGVGQEPARRAPEEYTFVIDDAADVLSEMIPAAKQHVLAKRGRQAAKDVRRAPGLDSDTPWKLDMFRAVVPALCVEAADLGPVQAPALGGALEAALDLADHADDEAPRDQWPARTRLARIAAMISRSLYREYLGAVRARVRGGAGVNE